MTLVWNFYWPVLIASVVLGLAGSIAGYRQYRGKSRKTWLGTAGAAALAIAFAWHLLGAGNRFADAVEASARLTLTKFEMTGVTARLERGPLSRTLILTGPADDFQQRELVRMLEDLPGVGTVRWDRPLEPPKGL